MIFTVQRFLEDYFERRGLADVDQYAVRVANVYERHDAQASEELLARDFGRIRTVFYKRNRQIDRSEFVTDLARTLRRKFKKKSEDAERTTFARGFAPARTRFRAKRRSVEVLLAEFKKAVEARGIDSFWTSRKKNRLRSRPEKIAQALLGVAAKMVVGGNGYVIREVASGIGFVDVGISFGGVPHLVELKVLTAGAVTGVNQLATYMKTEGRRTGWLVVIDARKNQTANAIPAIITTTAGSIRTVIVNVNPDPPSK